jgi:transcriptional regulator with XRE-family HTH domain
MPRRSQPDPLALAIGTRVRALREEAGLTLEKLAYESELGSKGHLSSLERGLVMPTVQTLEKLAVRLGVLVADLVSDPKGTERERLLELTRHLSPGALRTLSRDLTVAVKSARQARPPR